MDLQAKLANLRRLRRARFHGCVAALGSGLVHFRKSLLHLGDISLGLHDIRMVFGIARLQRQQLTLQLAELGFQALRIVRPLRRLPGRQLLRQHGFGVRLILLRAIYRLGIRIQLRIQRTQNLEVVVFIARQLPGILPLERRQFGILVIQVPLGFIELPADEFGGTDRRPLARILKFRQHRRGQIVTNVLRVTRGSGREVDVETRHASLPSLSFAAAGVSYLAQVGDHGLNLHACPDFLENVFQILSAPEQVGPLLDNRL